MQDELRNLETTLAKTQKATETAEIEIGRLRDELGQSSDQETSVRVQARKALKDVHDISFPHTQEITSFMSKEIK